LFKKGFVFRFHGGRDLEQSSNGHERLQSRHGGFRYVRNGALLDSRSSEEVEQSTCAETTHLNLDPWQNEMRILIAEADEQHLKILHTFLKRKGHEVKVASDELECSFELRNVLPDVCVLDDELLWVEGVMNEMRKDRSLDKIPVVLISDVDPRISTVSAFRIRFLHWLRKPFPLSELLERIDLAKRDRGISRFFFEVGGFHQAQDSLAIDFQSQKT
jgi:CheY-like chemotaxis protein